jgi:hypothetical protein
MPKTSKATASQVESVEGVLDDRSEDLDGYTASFTTFHADMDPAPLFKGLPDDCCQSPHWGYVLKGKMAFRFADREETYEQGDAFYATPGHTPIHFAGTEIVLFSPTEELAKTMEAVTRNLQETMQT